MKALARDSDGKIYLVDLDTDVPWHPVLAAGGPYAKATLLKRDGYAYAMHLDDYTLDSGRAAWADEQFDKGNLKVISRGDLER